MVDPVVAIRTLLLREALPDIALRPGTSVVARVASRGTGHGVLVLAGVPLRAALPDEVQAGATLRLRVADVTAERVTLQLEGMQLPPDAARQAAGSSSSAAPPAAPAAAPAADVPVPPPVATPPPAAPRPDARVAVGEPPRRRREDGEDVASVSLVFSSPALGRLDLQVELTQPTSSAGTGTSGRVEATIGARAGDPYDRAADESERLRATLSERVGRPATVRVRPRHDPVDLYA